MKVRTRQPAHHHASRSSVIVAGSVGGSVTGSGSASVCASNSTDPATDTAPHASPYGREPPHPSLAQSEADAANSKMLASSSTLAGPKAAAEGPPPPASGVLMSDMGRRSAQRRTVRFSNHCRHNLSGQGVGTLRRIRGGHSYSCARGKVVTRDLKRCATIAGLKADP
eukprot:scaffold6480_cov82-Isochrysis_galbana.AAC.2